MGAQCSEVVTLAFSPDGEELVSGSCVYWGSFAGNTNRHQVPAENGKLPWETFRKWDVPNALAYEASEWDLVNGTLFPWPLLVEEFDGFRHRRITEPWKKSVQHYRNRVTGEVRVQHSTAGATPCHELSPPRQVSSL